MHGYFIGVAIGVIVGIIAAMLIYAIFTEAFDVRMILAIVGPLAGALIAQQWLQDLLKRTATEDIVVGAVSAFLIIIFYPAAILMVRFGRDVGQAPPKRRRPRGVRR